MSQIPTTADLPRDTRDPDPVTTPRYPPPPAPAATTATATATATTRPPPVTATANNLAGNQVSMQAALTSANGDPLVALETILGERNTLSAQNSQLWKIIEKQRGMYNNLHKELDRVKAERDRLQTRSPAETTSKRSAAGDSASRKQITRSQSEDRRESQYPFCTSLLHLKVASRSPSCTPCMPLCEFRPLTCSILLLLYLALMAMAVNMPFGLLLK